jgi:hypothetical protein
MHCDQLAKFSLRITGRSVKHRLPQHDLHNLRGVSPARAASVAGCLLHVMSPSRLQPGLHHRFGQHPLFAKISWMMSSLLSADNQWKMIAQALCCPCAELALRHASAQGLGTHQWTH